MKWKPHIAIDSGFVLKTKMSDSSVNPSPPGLHPIKIRVFEQVPRDTVNFLLTDFSIRRTPL